MRKGKLSPPPSRSRRRRALLCGTILLGTIQAVQAQISPDDSDSVGAPTHRFTLSPAASAVQLHGQIHYSLSTAEAVTWEVNGIAGGSAATGTITPAGVYTAPATSSTPVSACHYRTPYGRPSASRVRPR
jgi:hypothetical protein